MSMEYDLYLKEHKANVRKGFEWIEKNLPEVVLPGKTEGVGKSVLWHQICSMHDASKYTPNEYDAYDAYFYGNNKSFEVVNNFNHAWLHHIHNNPHHWQHWVLNNDDPDEGEVILDMPYRYILEMICDWWAFSWKSDNLREIFKWYDEHKDYMKLSTKTRDIVESILDKIKTKLDDMEVTE